MKKKLSNETIESIISLVKAAAAQHGLDPDDVTAVTINQPSICDRCQDDNKEAFPIGVTDGDGNRWQHLCNECYEELGIVLDDGSGELEWGCPICGSMNIAQYEEPEMHNYDILADCGDPDSVSYGTIRYWMCENNHRFSQPDVII